jgi:hypothetical protein
MEMVKKRRKQNMVLRQRVSKSLGRELFVCSSVFSFAMETICLEKVKLWSLKSQTCDGMGLGPEQCKGITIELEIRHSFVDTAGKRRKNGYRYGRLQVQAT